MVEATVAATAVFMAATAAQGSKPVFSDLLAGRQSRVAATSTYGDRRNYARRSAFCEATTCGARRPPRRCRGRSLELAGVASAAPI